MNGMAIFFVEGIHYIVYIIKNLSICCMLGKLGDNGQQMQDMGDNPGQFNLGP